MDLNDDITILTGDCRETLSQIEPGSVQTCVTSPPYFNLRDYGTAEWEGGDVACDHIRQNHLKPEISGKQLSNTGSLAVQYTHACAKCGARRKTDIQIGLEQTPEAYVAQLVEVFRLVRRALRDDGTLWLNLGDSYAGSGERTAEHANPGISNAVHRGAHVATPVPNGCKPKDLIGIPWLVAFALRADGWYLRSDIVWAKPGPMPESVLDRPTRSHEYIFLLSKSARYFYDVDAIREPYAESSAERYRYRFGGTPSALATCNPAAGGSEPHHCDPNPNGRNKRDVWTVAQASYKGAHFATYPPDLIKPCILAGSKAGDLVLDPFTGSGTTGFVARELGRRFVGCELNPEYVKLAHKRIAGAHVPLPGLFA